MDYREASAQAPTDDGPIQAEIRNAMQSYSAVEKKHEACMSVMFRRAADVTMTLALTEKDDIVKYYLNDGVLGMRQLPGTDTPDMHAFDPVHDSYQLQSLRQRCARCKDNACGREGQFHNVTYKTGQKQGNAKELASLRVQGVPVENTRTCEVDPETGLFLKRMSPIETKKILKQFGENVAKPRWVDRHARKGDRWIVRDCAHWERYVKNRPAYIHQDEPMTSID